MTKQLVVFAAAVMTTLLALAALWQFRIVVIYIVISLALAATVRPLVMDWKRRSLVMRLILIVLYLVVLGGFGFFISIVGRHAIDDIQQFTGILSARGTWIFPNWLEGSSFQRTLVIWLPPPEKVFEVLIGEQGQLVLPAMLSLSKGFGGFVSAVLLILFLSVYWSINQIHFERLWLSLLPSEQRKRAREIWRTIEPDLGAYIGSEIIQSLLAGILLALGYWLLGSEYPMFLALVGALAWLIPVVGAPLATLMPLLMGLLTGVQLSLFTVLYTLVVLISLQVWVEPRLFRSKWNNPILTLIILLVMADAFGLLGILIAPPLSMVGQILWSLLVSNRLTSGAAVEISDLKERQARLFTVMSEMKELPPPLVTSSMERLAVLLEKAEPILSVSLPVDPSKSSLP